MKLLLDENLSPHLIDRLADLYPDSAHVHQLGLGAAEDRSIWEHAKAYAFVIVSKDADFAERSVLEHAAPKVLWLRLGNCSTAKIEQSLRVHNEVILGFVRDTVADCLAIA